jgi:uncharacterized protein YndB with AHSA1/START domain
MSAISEEITIAVTPARLWEALTQQEEIVRWWAYDARLQPEVGSLAEFRFRQGAFALQFEVAELDQHQQIRWLLRQGPPEWAGTSVTWSLAPVQSGTRLVFTHDGFASIDARTRATWVYFLASLKSYLETGKGTPGIPPAFQQSAG